MTKSFDVFLSHNSKDKPAVLELAEALRARGLEVWLDKWELVPGRPWQEALEDVIETCRSSAVLVGKDGLGPWHAAEMRGCLTEFVRRDLPVIPVLLPGAPAEPRLPLFLTQVTWVDLRSGLTEEGLDELQWGITGKKPNWSKSPFTPTLASEVVASIEAELLERQPTSSEVRAASEIEAPVVAAQAQPDHTPRELPVSAIPLPPQNEEKKQKTSPVETTELTASREAPKKSTYKPVAKWWRKDRLKAGVVAAILLMGPAIYYLLLPEPKPIQPSLQKPPAVAAEPEQNSISDPTDTEAVEQSPTGSMHDNYPVNIKNPREAAKEDVTANQEPPNNSGNIQNSDREQTSRPPSLQDLMNKRYRTYECSDLVPSPGETVLTDDKTKFADNEKDLSPEASSMLTALVERELIKDAQIIKIQIRGHTDSLESPKSSCQLGLKRAEAVRDFLVQQGLPHEKMQPISYGANFPVGDNATVEGRAQNRRVTLIVLH